MSNPFHQHLDICKQCDEQPSNLCPEGVKQFYLAAKINLKSARHHTDKSNYDDNDMNVLDK